MSTPDTCPRCGHPNLDHYRDFCHHPAGVAMCGCRTKTPDMQAEGTATRLSDADWRDLKSAHERDAWAGEWNSLPTAIDRLVARLAQSAPRTEADEREKS